MNPQPLASSGYGAALAQTLVALALVCALAWWLLRWGGRRALGGFGEGRVEVLERAPLDARRAVFLVRVGKRVLVVGASDQSLTLLAELRDDELPPARPATPGPFDGLAARWRGAASGGARDGGAS